MPFDNVMIEVSWEKIDAPVVPTSAEMMKNLDTAVTTPAIYCVLFGVLSATVFLVRHEFSKRIKLLFGFLDHFKDYRLNVTIITTIQ